MVQKGCSQFYNQHIYNGCIFVKMNFSRAVKHSNKTLSFRNPVKSFTDINHNKISRVLSWSSKVPMYCTIMYYRKNLINPKQMLHKEDEPAYYPYRLTYYSCCSALFLQNSCLYLC